MNRTNLFAFLFPSLRFSVAAMLLLVLPALAQNNNAAPPAPQSLRVEYMTNPIGVDVLHPRFSWLLPESGRGKKQAAYQILVSAKADAPAGDIWDSGRIASERSVNVPYAGRALRSGETCYWKVRYWDNAGGSSPYSQPARFEMGLVASSEWRGQWIGGGNQLRREFQLDAKPVRARAYVAGLGYYEMRINGHKVGNHVLDPAWTTYDKRVLYVTYDVTGLLRPGANAIGLMLGQGWYASHAALLQLNVELEGGRTFELATDPSWKVTQGPILADSIYGGEVYDARQEKPGWDMPGFSEAGWKAAALVDAPKGVLSSQMMPPIRVVDTIVPVKVTSPRPGMYVYDMGQNFSGWVRLRVRGPRGTRVTLRHAELVYDDGTINTENLRKAKATDVYILRGGDEEVYEPRFTYHGFRYVEVTGYPGTPTLASIRGRVVHSAVRQTGSFSASKQVLNDIQRIILWGVQTNLHSVPTDCDQRDERMGWMADAHLAAEAAIQNFDMAAFYTNFLRDIRDIQSADGAVTDTVPHKYGRRPADPAWGSAYPLFVWYMYLYYGDHRILEEHYDGIKAWTDFLTTRAENGILSYSYYGDWVPIEKTPGDLVSTFYYYWSADVVSHVARVLGKSADAESYRRLAEQIRTAFHKKFFDPATGNYANGTQTANVMPLYLNLAPKEVQSRVLANLRQDIVYTRNTHLTTGILGTKYLLPLLTRTHNSDLAYELATQTTYPSWGYMIANSATTLWELWQNKTGPSMNSHNHPMFGSVGGWFYQALAGIEPDPEHPGYRRVRIEPQMVRDLRWASGTIETPLGPLTSSWRRTEDSVRLEVVIPPGSEAEVHVPKLGLDSVEVEESGKPAWKEGVYQPGVPGLSGARQTDQAIVFQAGSGHYVFHLTGH